MVWVRDEATSNRMVLANRREEHSLWVSFIGDTGRIGVRVPVVGGGITLRMTIRLCANGSIVLPRQYIHSSIN